MPDYPDLSQIAGNVVRNPERKTAGDKDVVKFSVAVPRQYGAGENNTKFVDVTIWNADLCDQVMDGPDRLQKGMKVVCEGNAKTREWDGRTFYDFSAMRIGLVAWIAKTGSKAASPADKDDF